MREFAVNAYQGVKKTIKYYTDKRFSTIAGTLVYFFLMSITPFLLWLTLVFGNVDVSRFLNHRLLEGASPVLRYLKSSAEAAAGNSDGTARFGDIAFNGAGIVFLATSLYSSSNFFYHLRRSGEIVYESQSLKGGIKLRLLSVALIGAALLMIALVAGVSVVGTTFMEMLLPAEISDAISLVFITALMFGTAVVMNIFACPKKISLFDAACGSLLTTALWLVAGTGFGIYMGFASPEKLYGKIASLIVFLLWCYVMMCCFVIGMINNRRHVRNRPVLSEALYGKGQKNKELSSRKPFKDYITAIKFKRL